MRLLNTYVPLATAITLVTGPGRLLGVLASAESTNTPQPITIYDNTASSGTIIWKFFVVTNSPLWTIFPPGFHLPFTIGLRVVTYQYANCLFFYGIA